MEKPPIEYVNPISREAEDKLKEIQGIQVLIKKAKERVALLEFHASTLSDDYRKLCPKTKVVSDKKLKCSNCSNFIDVSNAIIGETVVTCIKCGNTYNVVTYVHRNKLKLHLLYLKV